MGRPRNPARDEALRLWQQSRGKLTPFQIAEKLGIPANRVRNWKLMDKWDARGFDPAPAVSQPEPKERNNKETSQKETSQNSASQNVTKSKPSGPGKGNHHAHGTPGNKGGHGVRGNKGGHAPLNNKNALIHGAFERYAYGHMEADEAEVAKDALTDPDIEAELRSSLAFLKARELRLMKRIERIRNMEAEGEAATIAARQSTVSDTQRDIHKGGEHEHTEMDVTSTSSTEDMLNKLEAELHKVHNQKVKILTQLDNMKLQRERLEVERMRVQGENDQSRLANEWVQALLAVMSEGERGEGDE